MSSGTLNSTIPIPTSIKLYYVSDLSISYNYCKRNSISLQCGMWPMSDDNWTWTQVRCVKVYRQCLYHWSGCGCCFTVVVILHLSTRTVTLAYVNKYAFGPYSVPPFNGVGQAYVRMMGLYTVHRYKTCTLFSFCLSDPFSTAGFSEGKPLALLI